MQQQRMSMDVYLDIFSVKITYITTINHINNCTIYKAILKHHSSILNPIPSYFGPLNICNPFQFINKSYQSNFWSFCAILATVIVDFDRVGCRFVNYTSNHANCFINPSARQDEKAKVSYWRTNLHVWLNLVLCCLLIFQLLVEVFSLCCGRTDGIITLDWTCMSR